MPVYTYGAEIEAYESQKKMHLHGKQKSSSGCTKTVIKTTDTRLIKKSNWLHSKCRRVLIGVVYDDHVER